MAKITAEQVRVVYRYANLWLQGSLTNREARDAAVSGSGISSGSAANLILIVRGLREGKRFTRTLSHAAAETLLELISSDFGEDGISNAVRALDQHIEYYENLDQGNRPGLKAIADRWRPRMTFDCYLEKLEKEVVAMASLPASERRKRLPKAGNKPKSRRVSTKIYERNAAVIAEALAKADGVCERCKAKAPFLRAKDGTPYLEVHHKVPLAEGGEDTLGNAEALCPNCHRLRHFG
ncbi:MAG: HNH endonuclease signature motif containing protein [Erythrobacter sp.]|nr:HNH endonuclease signature motif containing protein [Erythrobacter sp.]